MYPYDKRCNWVNFYRFHPRGGGAEGPLSGSVAPGGAVVIFAWRVSGHVRRKPVPLRFT